MTEPWQAGAEGPHLLWLLVEVVESHNINFYFKKPTFPVSSVFLANMNIALSQKMEYRERTPIKMK